MKNNIQQEELDTTISKTKRKEQMEDLQSLGIELVKTSKDKLAKLELPETLLEAIRLAQKINSNGAIRRQYQYIGKLMRNVDADALKSKLNYLNGDDKRSTQVLHLSEKWRDRLLAEDSALDLFIAEFNSFDISELRGLLRQVRSEREHNLNRNYTKFFRLIKTIIEEQTK